MTSVKRPDFIDSPYFVGEPDNWHLKPGAPKEVVREFNEFMKATNSSFIEVPDEIREITLHAAIRKIINTYGPATISEIAEKINQENLYTRREGKPVPKELVSARIRKYPYMFIRENGLVSLNESNRILSLEAFVGGHFGTSYNVTIDLESRLAIYKKFEEGYQIEGDREIRLDNTMVENFQSDMDSIRILDWDKEYYSPALDGTSWSVTIKTNDRVFESSGSNAFPRQWGKFCRSIEDVVKGEFR